MATTRPTRSARRSAVPARPGYWSQAKQPLHVLVFLLPLIIAYELGLAVFLRSEQGVLSNVAHVRLVRFFQDFGINVPGGMYLGGVAIVVVLLVWQVLSRDPWRINGRVIGIMALESLALTLPLIVFGQIITRTAISTSAMDVLAMSTEQHIRELDLWSRLAISVGAGLYEELLFRMMLIAVIHTLLVDLGKASFGLGAAIAVVVSAVAFAWYHPLTEAAGTFSWRRLVFYFTAGLYFGAIFVFRGFGIVVAVHALYDVIMVTMAAEASGPGAV